MSYPPGARIALEHTTDPHTRLQPGDEGTVQYTDAATHTVHITWDSGSQLAMCLDAGDRIRLLQPVEDHQAVTADQPQHGDVHAVLSGHDGNAHTIIQSVAAALRAQVGTAAADAFVTQARACSSYDDLLQLAMRTVHVS